MKMLVVGSGAREHSIAWKLQQELAEPDKLFIAPGRETWGIGEIVPVDAENIHALADFACKQRIDMTVVGPEAPLAAGIVDAFEERGLKIFGPSKAAAEIESSKIYAKTFMHKHDIPTAEAYLADSPRRALDFGGYLLDRHSKGVIKADGLAAGKGTEIFSTKKELQEAVNNIMRERKFKDAVVEKFLDGEEASFIVWTDGEYAIPLITTQDHKILYADDKGPMTGGMGAYTNPSVTKGMEGRIMEEIMLPAIRGLASEGRLYKGVLYAGLMIVGNEPYVLEFNARYGDPETQAVMPLLKSSLLDITYACVEGHLKKVNVEWHPQEAVCVVLATKGYPSEYENNCGKTIYGLNNLPDCVSVFHAGTRKDGERIVNAGGRVLSVVGMGDSLLEAYTGAYSVIGTHRIYFVGMHYRTDIANKTLSIKC